MTPHMGDRESGASEREGPPREAPHPENDATQSLEALARRVLSDLTGQPADHFDPDQPFAAASGVDSLVVLQLVAAVEEALEVRIPDEDFERIRTLREIVEVAGRAAGRR